MRRLVCDPLASAQAAAASTAPAVTPPIRAAVPSESAYSPLLPIVRSEAAGPHLPAGAPSASHIPPTDASHGGERGTVREFAADRPAAAQATESRPLSRGEHAHALADARPAAPTAGQHQQSAPTTAHRAARTRAAAAAMALVLALAAALAGPAEARADVAPATEKIATPVIASYQVRNDDEAEWQASVNAAQGEDIPFSVTGTLPANLDDYDTLEYWLVATPGETLRLVGGSFAVTLYRRYADGTSSTRDITQWLTMRTEGNSVIAGATDIKEALVDAAGYAAASDQLTLSYAVRFREDLTPNLGFKVRDNVKGNPSYAHVEYSTLTSQAVVGQLARHQVATLRSLRAPDAALERVVGDVPAPAAPALAARPAALHTSDSRSTDLAKSQELIATVYSYVISVRAIDGHSGAPLAGAGYVLRKAARNADGTYSWFAAGDSWIRSEGIPNNASTKVSNVNGEVEFVGVGAEKYELVPVQTPDDYLPLAAPVDVAVSADVAGEKLGVATASPAVLKNGSATDAEGGVVSLRVAYYKPGEEPTDEDGSVGNPGSTGNPSSGGNPGARDSVNPISSVAKLPKTGQLVLAVGLVATLSVLTLLAGTVLRRRAGRLETQWSPGRMGRAGQEKGMHHGGKQDVR